MLWFFWIWLKVLYWRLATALAGQTRCAWRRSERAELDLLL